MSYIRSEVRAYSSVRIVEVFYPYRVPLDPTCMYHVELVSGNAGVMKIAGPTKNRINSDEAT